MDEGVDEGREWMTEWMGGGSGWREWMGGGVDGGRELR